MSRTIKELITEEFLTCNICMDEFQNPKILKCLHTFCETCILSTIRHQRLNSSSGDISCPVCRTRIETNSCDKLNLQTNYPVQNLLEMIQSSTHSESFIELYRVKAGLNLDRAQAVAISEKSRCAYLQRNVDDLQNAVIGLRKELIEYKKQLTIEKDVTAKLKEQLVERNQTIDNLRKHAEDTENQFSELKVQKDNQEKVVDNLNKSSWMTNWCIRYIGKCLLSICQASVSWLPKWFQRKREENKRI
ncbi:tripartite motif-containing protein 2-like [Mercenaria mercenaria]|uniref:tripartite motif-containing protein 2-like n=1 Tax=Mercenaria mercenaria TaxID=6596 RepID=UPI00234FB429|nr:tripartite motif-containing protein 2-like [Mercenaria mercenaria]XP_053403519.1 tripartite motif-containing protein 2-like [Mercenaria mercenaria]